MVHVLNISIYMYLYHPPAAAIFSRAKISAAIEGSGCLCANLCNMWFSWQLHSIPHPCFPGFGQLPPGSKGSRFPAICLKKSFFLVQMPRVCTTRLINKVLYQLGWLKHVETLQLMVILILHVQDFVQTYHWTTI